MKHLLYIGNNLQFQDGLPTGISSLSRLLAKEGYTIETASSRKNKLFRLLDMMLMVILHSGKADFVLIDTYSTQNFWYAYSVAQLCQKLNLKYIPILHGGNLPRRLEENPKACSLIFDHAFLNVAPSAYLLDSFKKRGFNRIKYIPNSISLKKYPFLRRKVLQPKLLWVRAFAEIYNPLLAIKTFELLRNTYPEAELCMVGPEKDNSFQECRQYVLENKLPVEFKGKLKKDQWIDLSQEYDIFINTSNVDNTPVSVIEAMALGLVVVSTNVGGMPYFIQDQENGILVAPDCEEDMNLKIVKLLKEPQRAEELACAARSKVEAFDWGVVRKKWMSIFE